MAMIDCPECKKQISDKAAACPHCGNPITARAAPTADSKGDSPSIAMQVVRGVAQIVLFIGGLALLFFWPVGTVFGVLFIVAAVSIGAKPKRA